MNDIRYLQVFRQYPYMLILLSIDLTIVDASDFFLEKTNTDRKDIVHKNLFHVFPESQSSKSMVRVMENNVVQVIKSGKTSSVPGIRYDIFNKSSGEYETKFWRMESFPVNESDSVGFSGFSILHEISDITEKVQNDNAMDIGFRSDIFKLMVENIHDYAIIMLDVNGNVATWSPGAVRLYRYTASDIIGKHFSLFHINTDVRDEIPESEMENARKYGRSERELWLVRKDGSFFWGNVIITAVYDNNRILLGYAKSTRDLTEKKEYEKNLKDAYEESSKLKSEFLSNMSHEIRTPMHGIMTAANLLSDSTCEKERQELVKIITRSSKDMVRLVNDILDYSKLDSEKVDFSTNYAFSFSFNDEIREIVENFQNEVRKSVKPVKIVFKNRFRNIIKTDKKNYTRVVRNLVDNAVKFTDNGTVSVDCKIIKRGTSGYFLKTIVTDTGIGISEKDFSRLFTPFSQLDVFNTKRYQGTGLGLSICKKIIEKLDGKIGVKSKVGQGSTFWFTIPFNQCYDEHAEMLNSKKISKNITTKNITEIKHYRNIEILIAEDNPINQSVILRVLKKFGYNNLTLAVNGEDAFNKFSKKNFDIILMDIQMPVMDGFQSTIKIRDKNEKIPIIAMTANVYEGYAEQCFSVGMNEYIPKPIDFKLLKTILEKYTIPESTKKIELFLSV